MHIHARSLKYFDMIRRCGSIREAARQLHVASSAINRQLLLLEDEIGGPLFERMVSGMRLTPAGEAFSRHVINVFQDEGRLHSELNLLRGIHKGDIHIAAVEGVNADFLPGLIWQMQQRYPGVQLHVCNRGSDQVAQSVLEGDADIGIGFSLQRQDGLRQYAGARFALGVVMQPQHPLAQMTQVNFGMCAAYPLILPTPELSTYAQLQPLLMHHKSALRVIMESSSIELSKQLVERGLGLCFQSRLGLERELSEGRLLHLPLDTPVPLYSELGVYIRSERTLPPAVDALLNLAKELLDVKSRLVINPFLE